MLTENLSVTLSFARIEEKKLKFLSFHLIHFPPFVEFEKPKSNSLLNENSNGFMYEKLSNFLNGKLNNLLNRNRLALEEKIFNGSFKKTIKVNRKCKK